MMILRRARKLATALPAGPDPGQSDTALGDWYVNRPTVDRRPLLILVSSSSLLAILLPARDVARLPERLAGLVRARLQRSSIAEPLINAETEAMSPVLVAPTKDRSVMGTMVEFAASIPFYLPIADWDETTLPFVEARLAETPCRASRRFEEVIFPQMAVLQRLEAKWGAG